MLKNESVEEKLMKKMFKTIEWNYENIPST